MKELRVFVAAWVGSDNLGDELIFRALAAKLRRLGVTQVAVPSRNPVSTGKTHGVRALGDMDVVGIGRAIAASDAVVFGGGGLVQDSTSLWNLPYHYSRLLTAKVLRRRFAAVGLGVGPLHRRISRILTELALRGHSGLAVRDAQSAQLLRSVGLSDVSVSADLVFSLQPDIPPREDALAVCLRPVRPVAAGWRPASRWNLEGLDEWIRTAASTLDEASRRTGLSIRFVAFDRVRDHSLHERIAEQMTSPGVQMTCPDIDEVWDAVGRSTAVIGMRFHACIVSLMCGRPVVGIGYDPKVDALSSIFTRELALTENSIGGLRALPQKLDQLLRTPRGLSTALLDVRSAERINDQVLGRLLLD